MATKEMVMELVAIGLSNREIAHRLGCADSYVRATRARARGYKPPAISRAEREERISDHRDLDMLWDIFEGHSAADVASHWGVSVAHVEQLISAARAA